jgi:hypothetical protein
MSLVALTMLTFQANASIFNEFMQIFLEDTTADTYTPLLIWQLSGLVVPLLAGPCRGAAYALFTFTQDVGGITISSETMQAMLYVDYKIKSIDDLMVYLVDYIIYGLIYPAAGLSTTFTEINFFPANLNCYLYNWWDGVSTTVNIPTFRMKVAKNWEVQLACTASASTGKAKE